MSLNDGRDYGDETNEAVVVRQLHQRIDEYQAEIRALKAINAALSKRRRQTGAMIEMGFADGRTQWVVTAPDAHLQHKLAEAVAASMRDDIVRALKMTVNFFGPRKTGSDVDAKAQS